MASSNGSNSRMQVRKNLLKNHKIEVSSSFDKYRKFVNLNPQFRVKFFGYLKIEILNSLNFHEKLLLLQEIQNNLYDNSAYVDHINSDLGNLNTDTFENWLLNEDTVTSRSTEPRAGDLREISNFDSLPTSLISVSGQDFSNSEDELSPSIGFENKNDDNVVIKKLFNEITEMIKNSEKVIKKLKNTRNTHGDLIYQEVLNYVPIMGDTDVANNKEPIIFQLALNIDIYESALDQIHGDNRLNLNLRNQYKMSIYNVLLLKNFDCLCKFLIYMKNKHIPNNIKYLYSTTDELSQMWSAQTERLKNMSISKSKENHLKVLQSITDGKSKVEDSYLKHLAQDFSGFFYHIDAIFKVDSNMIVISSFFVFLAEININHFFNFLELLISVYKINKSVLCQSCQLQSSEGKTVVSIVNENTDSEFEKSGKFIKEFIKRYQVR